MSSIVIDEVDIHHHIFDPDIIFKNMEIIEMPTSFVGLSNTMELDIGDNLISDVYCKSTFNGRLMNFDDARKISAAHRAFNVEQIGEQNLKITFTPTSECISKNQHLPKFDMSFLVDLRVIRVSGTLCCNSEKHAEIKRFYILGKCVYCDISSYPEILDFGDVMMNKKITKYVRLHNRTSLQAKVQSIKMTSFDVLPVTFTIEPNSVRHITVIIYPTSIRITHVLNFKILNPHDCFKTFENCDGNFIAYKLKVFSKIKFYKTVKHFDIESMHKLNEKNRDFTYIEDEFEERDKRKAIGLQLLEDSRATRAQPKPDKISSHKGPAYINDVPKIVAKTGRDFCKLFPAKPSSKDLIEIYLEPFYINFGRVANHSYEKSFVIIKNISRFEFTIHFEQDAIMSYTQNKLHSYIIKVKPRSENKIIVYCKGFTDGFVCQTFPYTINSKYHRFHRYTLWVGNPKLQVKETNLKFGLITSDAFVTSVPMKMYNFFNEPVGFIWDEFCPETPFEANPKSGVIPAHSSRICEIVYVCKMTKTKTHELDIISKGHKNVVIPIEATVLSRKVSVKFLEVMLCFKDIPLNSETTQTVKMENASRDYATFHVIEPLMPGVTAEPMNGVLRPKMLIKFEVTIKIPCIIDFNTEVTVKINNKEVISLAVSGSVAEPKVNINPKCITMSRVPCYMVTYIPLNIVNASIAKAVVEVIDTGDENMFDIVMTSGIDKVKFSKLELEPGHTKTVYVKVTDVYRREYDMYLPFRINGLLGPPVFSNSSSTELLYYIGDYQKQYEINAKIKTKPFNMEIAYCRITGVITVPWIQFSVDSFEIEFLPFHDNSITFKMKNISRYYLYITIFLMKLFPNFTLELLDADDVERFTIGDNSYKFDLDREEEVTMCVKFHPRGRGKFIATAPMYLDKVSSIQYSDLTFIGYRQLPTLTPELEILILPPCQPGYKVRRSINIKIDGEGYDLNEFECTFKEEKYLELTFAELREEYEDDKCYTILRVVITACSPVCHGGKDTLTFFHPCGGSCEVFVSFSFTTCPLTLHRNDYIDPTENPYPFYPLPENTEYYNYMNSCKEFVECWLFQQGFRRELFPEIPNTFLSIANNLPGLSSRAQKQKGVNVSYINFAKRIAGHMIKSVKTKVTGGDADEAVRSLKEIALTYKELIALLKGRGSYFWGLKPKFLLSYDQFVAYSELYVPRSNTDIIMTQSLIADENLFDRLNTQSWLDFILQNYRAFVIDSCIFDCVCVSGENRDIVRVITDWYNRNIMIQHKKLFNESSCEKYVNNLTTDLSDGVAIISVFLSYCPFLTKHFSLICKDYKNCDEGVYIHNAALIIEAINMLKIYFPLSGKDFLEPKFLHMLFLSIHLYISLPMFTPREIVKFSPPLLRGSSRRLIVGTGNQEALMFSIVLINNEDNNFSVEKTTAPENGKKLHLIAKFTANFLKTQTAVLLLHGYNKNRIFDTYIVFILEGKAGSINPFKKCKITAPLYRPMKVDVLLSTPFPRTAVFNMYLTDKEPTLPVQFEEHSDHRFYLQRIYLLSDRMTLSNNAETVEEKADKITMLLICLSVQQGTTWVWFSSEIGQFYIRLMTHSRYDVALDILQTRAMTMPLIPCSCGEDCECYRTSTVTIPHKNEYMIKAVRCALSQLASSAMLDIFDKLIETHDGRKILYILFEESGTNMAEIEHILEDSIVYNISSRGLTPQIQTVTLKHHANDTFILPVTLPITQKTDKLTILLTSDQGTDMRTYKVFVLSDEVGESL